MVTRHNFKGPVIQWFSLWVHAQVELTAEDRQKLSYCHTCWVFGAFDAFGAVREF